MQQPHSRTSKSKMGGVAPTLHFTLFFSLKSRSSAFHRIFIPVHLDFIRHNKVNNQETLPHILQQRFLSNSYFPCKFGFHFRIEI